MNVPMIALRLSTMLALFFVAQLPTLTSVRSYMFLTAA